MAYSPRWFTVVVLGGVGLGLASSCLDLLDANHCSKTGVECADGMVCDPCTPTNVEPNGCVAAVNVLDQDMVTPGCQGPDGSTSLNPTDTVEPTTTTLSMTDGTVTDTIDPDTSTTTMVDTETTTGPPIDCTAPDGQVDPMCPASAPFCVGEFCAGCDAVGPGSCTEELGGLVCNMSNGTCVECVDGVDTSACSGTSPYCDPDTNTCVPCSDHDHCGMSGCNLFSGECIGGSVEFVGAGFHLTIGEAVGAVGVEGTIIIYAGMYDEAVTVSGDTVALLANDGDVVDWRQAINGGGSQLEANANATVFVEGLEFRVNPTPGDPAVRVSNADLWMDRSIIAQNTGVALGADSGGNVVIRNSFVAGAGSVPAINIIGGSTVTAQYITASGVGFGSVAVACDGSSEMAVSDSILISQDATGVDCMGTFNAENTVGNTFGGVMDMGVGMANTNWFTTFSTGDFHLSMSGQGVFENIAEWNEGDPLVDFDDAPRSGVEGTPEHAGADLP